MNYRGEWFVMFKLRTPFEQLFPDGDKELNYIEMENEFAPYRLDEAIAQVKFNHVHPVEWEIVQDLNDTTRGADGGLKRV